jgi:hypothetical protein
MATPRRLPCTSIHLHHVPYVAVRPWRPFQSFSGRSSGAPPKRGRRVPHRGLPADTGRPRPIHSSGVPVRGRQAADSELPRRPP